MKTLKGMTLTFEQYLQLDKIRELRYERSRKRRMKFMIQFLGITKKIIGWFLYGIKTIVCLLIAVFAGIGSEPTIYKLNEPLGLGYAHIASYAETGLIMVLLYIYILGSGEWH